MLVNLLIRIVLLESSNFQKELEYLEIQIPLLYIRYSWCLVMDSSVESDFLISILYFIPVNLRSNCKSIISCSSFFCSFGILHYFYFFFTLTLQPHFLSRLKAMTLQINSQIKIEMPHPEECVYQWLIYSWNNYKHPLNWC